jgi:hypothetical protein
LTSSRPFFNRKKKGFRRERKEGQDARNPPTNLTQDIETALAESQTRKRKREHERFLFTLTPNASFITKLQHKTAPTSFFTQVHTRKEGESFQTNKHASTLNPIKPFHRFKQKKVCQMSKVKKKTLRFCVYMREKERKREREKERHNNDG